MKTAVIALMFCSTGCTTAEFNRYIANTNRELAPMNTPRPAPTYTPAPAPAPPRPVHVECESRPGMVSTETTCEAK